ncbi:MAG: iron-containing alcohol dehydrogenase [Bacteroidales bacterium]
MISNFSFAKLPLIHFGCGKLSALPQIIWGYGSTVIVVSGKGSFNGSVYFEDFREELQKKSIRCIDIVIDREPSPAIINKVVEDYSDEDPVLVVAIGGGSTMDAGKAISAMLPVGGDVTRFLEVVGNYEHPGKKIPFIAVPTTSGTGSEATKNAVLSEVGKNGFKRSLRHENLVPDIAVVDPLLTVSCPPELTAAGGMDCFTQLVESYVSTKALGYTDAIALKGLLALRDSLERAYADGSDIEARTGMSFAALSSGICLANAGLGTVHGFASSVGALFDIPHGVICGTLMAPANEITLRELRRAGKNHPAISRYAELGRLFSREEGKSEDYYTGAFIGTLYHMAEKLKLPLLGKYGVTTSDVERIVSNTDNKNNPVKLSQDHLAELLSKRI